jgi:TP901 family phage tail tape measure protein
MAQQVVISFNANANFSDLIGEIKRANAEIGVLQNQLQGLGSSSFGSLDILNKQFIEGMKNSRMWSSSFVDVTNETREFGRHLDQGRLKLKDYFREFNTQVKGQRGMIRKLAEEQVRLQRSVLTTTVGPQGQTRNVLSTPTGLDGLDPATMKALKSETFKIIGKSIQGVSTELINLGKNTQWAGRQLTVGLTVPLTMFAASAAMSFKEVDKQLTRLAKVYGDLGGATSGEIAAIRTQTTALAKSLATDLGAPIQDTIGLAADIAATGKTGDDLLKSVAETTRLAVLGEVSRQDAMSATLSLQNAFNLSTQELGESINFLNAVENQTSTSLDDLVTAIPKAGPVVKSLGGDVKDLALFLTAMKEGGINAAEGANALKSGLASIINPTKQTTQVMNDFGIDIQGLVNNNAGDLVGTVQALQVALSKLDPLSKSKAIEQLFGKFQFARMSALFDNLGASGSQTLQVMDLMKASTIELANVADRELSILTESASGKFARQMESFKANMAGVGEGFLGVFSGVLGVLNKLLEGFNKLPDGVKNIMTILGVVVGLAGPLIMLSGVFLNFFGYLTKAVGFMGRLFTGTKGFELLNEKIMANKLSTDSMSNSFYDQARATEVARMEIDRLIASMTQLMAVQETSSTGAAIAGGSGKFAPQAMFQSRGGFMPGDQNFHTMLMKAEERECPPILAYQAKM